VDQKRVVDVLLNDASSLSVLSRVDDNVFYFSKIFCNLDALTSICVLARLDDPDVLRGSQRLIVWFLLLCLWLIIGLLRLLSRARMW